MCAKPKSQNIGENLNFWFQDQHKFYLFLDWLRIRSRGLHRFNLTRNRIQSHLRTNHWLHPQMVPLRQSRTHDKYSSRWLRIRLHDLDSPPNLLCQSGQHPSRSGRSFKSQLRQVFQKRRAIGKCTKIVPRNGGNNWSFRNHWNVNAKNTQQWIHCRES